MNIEHLRLLELYKSDQWGIIDVERLKKYKSTYLTQSWAFEKSLGQGIEQLDSLLVGMDQYGRSVQLEYVDCYRCGKRTNRPLYNPDFDFRPVCSGCNAISVTVDPA